MLSLLDWIYQMGLTDAKDKDDEGLIRELLEQTSQAGVFRFLTDDYTITWQEFALRLMAKARSTAWNGVMNQYFARANKFGANYLSVFYNVAQSFYNLALNDYLEAHGNVDMVMLSSKRRVRLTPKGALRNVSTQEYVDTIQLCTFDMERRDRAALESAESEYKAKKIVLNPKHYAMFRQAVGLAMMKVK